MKTSTTKTFFSGSREVEEQEGRPNTVRRWVRSVQEKIGDHASPGKWTIAMDIRLKRDAARWAEQPDIKEISFHITDQEGINPIPIAQPRSLSCLLIIPHYHFAFLLFFFFKVGGEAYGRSNTEGEARKGRTEMCNTAYCTLFGNHIYPASITGRSESSLTANPSSFSSSEVQNHLVQGATRLILRRSRTPLTFLDNGS